MKAIRGAGFGMGVITEAVYDFGSIPKHNWNYMKFENTDCNKE